MDDSDVVPVSATDNFIERLLFFQILKEYAMHNLYDSWKDHDCEFFECNECLNSLQNTELRYNNLFDQIKYINWSTIPFPTIKTFRYKSPTITLEYYNFNKLTLKECGFAFIKLSQNSSITIENQNVEIINNF